MRTSILLAAILTLCNFVKAQTNTALISVDKITIHSDILEEERTINVYLPDNYNLNEALQLLLYNNKYYPESPLVYNLIGEVYEKKGDHKNAILNYKKSWSFYPDDKIKGKIKELEKE